MEIDLLQTQTIVILHDYKYSSTHVVFEISLNYVNWVLFIYFWYDIHKIRLCII